MADIDDLSKIYFPAEDEYPILLALDAYVRDYESATTSPRHMASLRTSTMPRPS